MVKICIEICIISARGLRRKSSLLKPQWFAVGWIDPNNKYCTKIDTSGSPNPTWKTKFSVLIDGGDPKLKELSLTVEVHRREPIFLREHLQGVAVVPLKEFIAKFVRDDEGSRSLVEETGSFQLRKRSSGKPKGLVDVSISISEEREGLPPILVLLALITNIKDQLIQYENFDRVKQSNSLLTTAAMFGTHHESENTLPFSFSVKSALQKKKE